MRIDHTVGTKIYYVCSTNPLQVAQSTIAKIVAELSVPSASSAVLSDDWRVRYMTQHGVWVDQSQAYTYVKDAFEAGERIIEERAADARNAMVTFSHQDNFIKN